MTVPADFTAILARWEAERPDAVAITFGGTHRTWAELAHRVRRAAAALRAAGLAPGDRIAVLDLNHPSCLELTLACAQIGTANAVVNFRLAPPEIVYVINDAKARLLFVGPEFAGAVEKLREQLPSRRAASSASAAPTTSTRRGWPRTSPMPASIRAAPDDCFVQLYTSGTTGFPKGAMLTHRGMLAHSRNVAAEPGLRPGRARPGRDAAVPCRRHELCADGDQPGRAHLHDAHAGPGRGAGRCSRRERITHTFFVPALLAVMNQVPGAAERDYSALKALSYGASPMPLPVMRASLKLFPGVLQQVYGMTEQSGVVSVARSGRTTPIRPSRTGWSRPASRSPASRSRSATPATGEPVATGEPRRGLGAQRAGHGRLLGQARGHRGDDHARRLAALGRRRATSTPTATSTSPTASRT